MTGLALPRSSWPVFFPLEVVLSCSIVALVLFANRDRAAGFLRAAGGVEFFEYARAFELDALEKHAITGRWPQAPEGTVLEKRPGEIARGQEEVDGFLIRAHGDGFVVNGAPARAAAAHGAVEFRPASPESDQPAYTVAWLCGSQEAPPGWGAARPLPEAPDPPRLPIGCRGPRGSP